MTAVDDLRDELGDARAGQLVAKWERWGINVETTARRLVDARREDAIVAVCPRCDLWWTQTTPFSWWRRYVCCYGCMREVLGIDHVPDEADMEAYFGITTAPPPPTAPLQLALGLAVVP